MPLTVIACTKASTKPDGKPNKLADAGGLYLLVNKAGKYWRVGRRNASEAASLSCEGSS